MSIKDYFYPGMDEMLKQAIEYFVERDRLISTFAELFDMSKTEAADMIRESLAELEADAPIPFDEMEAEALAFIQEHYEGTGDSTVH